MDVACSHLQSLLIHEQVDTFPINGKAMDQQFPKKITDISKKFFPFCIHLKLWLHLLFLEF